MKLLKFHAEAADFAQVLKIAGRGDFAALVTADPALVAQHILQAFARQAATRGEAPHSQFKIKVDQNLAEVEQKRFDSHAENLNNLASCLDAGKSPYSAHGNAIAQ